MVSRVLLCFSVNFPGAPSASRAVISDCSPVVLDRSRVGMLAPGGLELSRFSIKCL